MGPSNGPTWRSSTIA